MTPIIPINPINLSIIIPAYNEEKRITATIHSVADFLKEKNISFEIIVVPNNCDDHTEAVVKNLAESIPEVRVVTVKNNGKKGNTKGLAITTGMLEAKGDYAIFIDADNATSFSEVIKFLSTAKDGYDVVIASRYVQGAMILEKQPLIRVFLSRVGNIIVRLLLLPGIKDTQCGFKLFSKKAAQQIFSKTTILGWGIDLEMLALAKYFQYKIKELPVTWKSQGESSVRSHAFFFTLKELFKIRKNIKNNFYSK